MSNIISQPKIEQASLDGQVIGWRIYTGGDTVLVWADQSAMPGIRLGRAFCPPIGKDIEYALCVLKPTPKGGEG